MTEEPLKRYKHDITKVDADTIDGCHAGLNDGDVIKAPSASEGQILERGPTAWQLGDKPVAFPAGTRMLFDQDTAPTGWTRDTTATLDDRCIRIVVGARAPDGGSWTISGLTNAGHSHITGSAGGHNHVGAHPMAGIGSLVGGYAASPYGESGSAYTFSRGARTDVNAYYLEYTSSAGAHTHGTDTIADTISSDGTWRPLYRDVIVASKD